MHCAPTTGLSTYRGRSQRHSCGAQPASCRCWRRGEQQAPTTSATAAAAPTTTSWRHYSRNSRGGTIISTSSPAAAAGSGSGPGDPQRPGKGWGRGSGRSGGCVGGQGARPAVGEVGWFPRGAGVHYPCQRDAAAITTAALSARSDTRGSRYPPVRRCCSRPSSSGRGARSLHLNLCR